MYRQKQSLEKWMRWEQHGNPSSHWTTALSDHWFPFFLAALSIVHLTLASQLPPADDELYYWAWSRTLSLSYFDHPPMVAYLIRLSTAILGNSVLGIRFFAVFFTFLLLLVIGSWCRNWCGRRGTVVAVALTPIGLLGALLITPDTPFLLFWALYVSWLASVNQIFSGWNDDPVARVYREAPIRWYRWVLGGVILGLGLLSKYSMGLAVPCSFIVLITRYRIRSWWLGYLVHLGVALIVSSPVLIFNFQHAFAPLHFQWGHALGGDGEGYFWRFVGSQAALLGVLPFLMLPWLLISSREMKRDPRLHVAFYFFLLPLLFALFQASKNYVEANWAMMAYITFWPMAQYLFSRNTIHWLGFPFLIVGFLPAFVISLALCVHIITPLKWIKPDRDRLGRLKAQSAVAQEIAKDIQDNNIQSPVYSLTYQWVSYLRYNGISAQQVTPDTRPSQFTLGAKETCLESKIILLVDSSDSYPQLKCFPSNQILREYPLVLRGERLATYQLIEFSRE